MNNRHPSLNTLSIIIEDEELKEEIEKANQKDEKEIKDGLMKLSLFRFTSDSCTPVERTQSPITWSDFPESSDNIMKPLPKIIMDGMKKKNG